jgi:feruloyl esterase
MRRFLRFGMGFAAVWLLSTMTAWGAGAGSCSELAKVALPNTTVTAAQVVAAGKFEPPAGSQKGKGPNPFLDLPAFCRVTATLAPTPDSDIKVEVWLPVEGWNGKYEAVGNGGWAGVIGYPALATAVRRGYAASATDTGHVGANASFVPGHPEKLNDYAFRSEHEMTVRSKSLIEAFYGNRIKYSYWNGCSTGGKQGLTEAQRYPNDFDGIIAGAPANYMIHLHVWSVYVAQATHKDDSSALPADKLSLLHNAVLEACDAADGVKDGILDDPRKCHFDPEVLACKNGDGAACLNPSQVKAAKQIYTAPLNPKTKKEIFPTMQPGSELGWTALAGPTPASVATDTFKYWIFNKPDWNFMTLNLDKDVEAADKIDNHRNNAIDPNLKPFFSHNGKLLMYHGWSDQLIAPENSINYYSSVVKSVGASKAADSMRLFMVPGMAHCGGGEGPNTFDQVTALEQWVEQGKAPETMVASRTRAGQVDRTRPLCAFPQVAKYKGSGSTDDAANFACALP